MFSLWLKEKNEKLPKPWGTYPLYLGVLPNNSAQRCSNINENFSEKTCALGDRPADRPSCEGSDVPCLFLQKVHQPQVPGLRCHHSTTEPNASYQTWPSNVLPEWSRSGSPMYYIMSLLSHIVPYVWQVTARWSTGKKAVRGYSLKSWSHMIKRHFDMRLVFHKPNKCTESQYVYSREKYSQGQLLRDVWGWTRHKKEKKRKSWRWNGVPDELSCSGELEETACV